MVDTIGSGNSRVALVTGAAQGVGAAIAESLAISGYAVLLTDVAAREDVLASRVAQLSSRGANSAAAVADVRSQADLDQAVAKAIERFGSLTTVIANAGYGVGAPFWELTEDQWADSLDVTLTGAWRTAKAAAPALLRASGAALVFVGSTAGVRANGGFASYVAAKHGLVGLMRAVALELAPHGVRANAVLLGTVDTPGTREPAQWRRVTGLDKPSRDDYLHAVARMHALPGAAPMAADRVADAVAWLASDASAYTTGATIPVDAGRLLLPGMQSNPH